MEILNQAYLGNPLRSYLFFLGGLAGSLVAAKLFDIVLRTSFRKVVERTRSELDDLLLDLVQRRAFAFVATLGAWFSFDLLHLPEQARHVIDNSSTVVFTLLVTLLVTDVVQLFFDHFVVPLAGRTETTLDDQVIPILRKTLKSGIWVLAILIIIDNFGYDIYSLLTGLGIGGLAVAMAAKDTLGNMFGSVSIFADRPFRLREVIAMGGHTGTVEEVGLRTTRLRTFQGTLVTIPNSAAASSVIENLSARPTRRRDLKIGLLYSTPPEKVARAVAMLREILEGEEGIDSYRVHFTDFGDSALIIEATWFFQPVADYAAFLDCCQRVNLALMEHLAAAGIGMAFPTVTVDLPGEVVGLLERPRRDRTS